MTQSDRSKQYADDSLPWAGPNWPRPHRTPTVTGCSLFSVCSSKEKNVVEYVNTMSHIRVHVKLKRIMWTSNSAMGHWHTNWNHLAPAFVYNTHIVTLVARWGMSIRLQMSRWLILLKTQVVKCNLKHIRAELQHFNWLHHLSRLRNAI